MKYIIATLGCKVNQYESEAMEQILRSHGHTPCAEGESADAVIVNTCAVTAEGARKARQTVRRLRRENPDGGGICRIIADICGGAGCALRGVFTQSSNGWRTVFGGLGID